MEGTESLPSWATGNDAGEGDEGHRGADEWLELIQQLLVAGGYFRARIPTLKAFDKVVGGLAWSINASYATEVSSGLSKDFEDRVRDEADALPRPPFFCFFHNFSLLSCALALVAKVDFDLFLREDAKIGEKIQLSEKIEKALQRMKCPHSLQAHQMEGLDYPQIYPVVQWLLTRVLDARAQFGNQLRRYSQYACESKQGYGSWVNASSGEGGLSVDSMLRERTEDVYGVARQLRRRERADAAENLQRRLNWTLMEYGHRNHLVGDVSAVEGGAGGAGRRQSRAGKSEGRPGGAGAQGAPAEEGFNSLEVGEDDDGTLSGAAAAQIVGRRVGEIQQAASRYSSEEAESAVAGHMRRREELRRHIAQSGQERDAMAARLGEAEREFASVAEERDKGMRAAQKLNRGLEELKAMLDSEEVGPGLRRVQPLVGKKRGLELEKERFKAQCEGERERLRSEAAEASAAAERAGTMDDSDKSLVSQYEEVSSQTRSLQQELSKVSRAVLFLRRTLDDIPNSNELTQYQKRFLELYDLVQLNLQETRNHYNTYNTISDTKEFLQKESKVMTSVYNGFLASKNRGAAGQRAFLEQLEGIAKGVDATRERFSKRFDVSKGRLDADSARLQEQLGLQREYLKTLAELKKAVARYERMATSPK